MHRLSGLLHEIKEWLESLAQKPYALHALFAVAVVEASLIPLPPDIPLIALAVARPSSSFRYATVCIAGSVAGAMIGYCIGAGLFDAVGGRIISILGMSASFDRVLRMYHNNAIATLVAAGFTNIPFSIFTIAAGFRRTLSPGTLLFGALLGRAVRFYLLAGVLMVFGPSVKRVLDRYLPAVAFGLVILFVAVMVALRLWS